MRASLSLVAPALVLVLAVTIRIVDPAALAELRGRAFDGFQSVRPRPYEDAPVRIIAIDDESLARLGQWPWPRVVVAKLVERLQDLGAAAIAFDVIFAEPDRTSPARLLPLLPPAAAAALTEAAKTTPLPDHDAILAATIGRGAVVMPFAVANRTAGPKPPRKAAIAVVGESPRGYVPTFDAAVTTLPVLADAAAGSGSVTVEKDDDAILRRIPLVVAVGDEIYPSLAVEALRVGQGAAGIIVKVSGAAGSEGSGGDTGVQAIRVGDLAVPTDPRGRLVLYDTKEVTERMIPAWRVLEEDFDGSAVDGRILFVGATAIGLFDVHGTPLHPAAPGVVQHALVAEQALGQVFLERPHWANALEIILVGVAGGLVLLAFALSRNGATWGAFVGLVVVPSCIAAAWHSFASYRLLLDPLAPAASALFVYLAATVASYLEAEERRRFFRRAFAQYLSPVLVEQLAADPSKLKLGGEAREISVSFSDIRGFTSISERLDAQSLARLMNRYLTAMSDVILRNGGTIDKYIGDAIMWFWNAPVDQPGHARHACMTALTMQDRLGELNAELAKDGEFPVLRTGIGIATGRCSVGNMGSEQRFGYTAIGDTVNLASRLEGQSKTYHVRIVLAESTAERVPDLALLELDLLRVTGKTEPVRIFTLLGSAELRKSREFEQLETENAKMLSAYRDQRWEDAAIHLSACREHGRAWDLDGFYELYAERLSQYTSAPPSPDWDGVTTALTK